MPSTEIVGAMPAPDGVVPDFSLTRTSVQQKFILTYATTLGIAIVLVLLRLYTRLYLLKSFGLDDCRFEACEWLHLWLTFTGAVIASTVGISSFLVSITDIRPAFLDSVLRAVLCW